VANRDAAIDEGLEVCMEISGLRVWVNESRSAMSQSDLENARWMNNPWMSQATR
jgi:hypothetical protein